MQISLDTLLRCCAARGWASCHFRYTADARRPMRICACARVVQQVPLSATDLATPAAALAAIRREVDAQGGAGAFSLVVISHLSSVPAVILPIEGIFELMAGVPVFVDGAHAPGQIPLDLNKLRAVHAAAARNATLLHGSTISANTASAVAGAVGYTGNMHKWMYTPKGTGFLWVRCIHYCNPPPLGVVRPNAFETWFAVLLPPQFSPSNVQEGMGGWVRARACDRTGARAVGLHSQQRC